jgi:hypothetical protein
LFFDGFGEFNEGGVEGVDVAFGEVGEETAEGDKVVGLGSGGKFVAAFVYVAVEPEAVFAEEFRGDFLRFDVAGELDEAGKVEIVVISGMDAAALFDLEGFKKIGEEIR